MVVAGVSALHCRSKSRNSFRPGAWAGVERGKSRALSNRLRYLAWLALPQARHRWQQLALLIALPMMAGGVFFTYTRSTWIGFAASGFVIAGFQMPRRWRVPALVGSVVAGTLLAIVSWSHLMGIHREGTVEDSEHSVAQRESFAYVSWKMFRDHPVLGVGFGRFFDQKLPYLSDRSQQIELESIRPLHHHNTFLSVLTETGIVGIAAFIAVFIAWGARLGGSRRIRLRRPGFVRKVC